MTVAELIKLLVDMPMDAQVCVFHSEKFLTAAAPVSDVGLQSVTMCGEETPLDVPYVGISYSDNYIEVVY